MRFALIIAFMCVVSGPAYADPGQIYSVSDTQGRVSSVAVARQARGSSALPQTIDGFQITRAANGLGDITAMALAEDGTLFVSDAKRGRVVRLSDRGRDGKIDTTQTHAAGLNMPGGLAVVGDWVYVADATAIWRTPVSGGSAELFVSLANTNAQIIPRPLLADPENNRILIGLSGMDDTAKVISVDLTTKRAELMASGQGTITALSGRPMGPYWAGLNGKLAQIIPGQSLNAAHPLEEGVEIGGLVLPGQFEAPLEWPLGYRDHILATQSGAASQRGKSSGGYNVIAIPTQFGQPGSDVTVLVDGFLSQSGRVAWGHPSTLIMDARGLFIADKWSGILWLMSKTAPPLPVVIIEPEPEPAETIAAKTETKEIEDDGMIRGSGITSGSGINTASKLEVGSIMAKEYEAREAERKAAEEKKNPKKSKKLDKATAKHSLD